MAGGDLVVSGSVLLAAAALAFLVLWLLSRIEDRSRRDPSLFALRRTEVVFLFDDEVLVDATPGARQLMSVAKRDGSAWARLSHVLLPRFPTLADEMLRLVDAGSLTLASTDGRSRLEAEWRNGLARLTLIDLERQDRVVSIDKLALAAMEAELFTLRGIIDEVPYLTWKEAGDGTVVWANAAFLDASERFTAGRPVQVWPPHPVFTRTATPDRAGRVSVTMPGDRQESWFDLRDIAMPDGLLRVALPADAVVRAERSRAEFVQTLSKTFASLTVGLAIFDRSRKLALFNPALTDLTGLPGEFLILRPGLDTFLDRLREARILPEPKNFGSWRHKLTQLEQEAATGTYAETWTLPDGQVFEVTGRPHPDGAIAFLIEDVSAEMRLTRQFRTELQLNQAVLDTLPEALAVFADDGGLVLANAAYCRMWSVDPRKPVQSATLVTALRDWRATFPGADWTQVAEAAGGGSRPMAFAADRAKGPPLDCRFLPLPGGALLAGFAPADVAGSQRLLPAVAGDVALV